MDQNPHEKILIVESRKSYLAITFEIVLLILFTIKYLSIDYSLLSKDDNKLWFFLLISGSLMLYFIYHIAWTLWGITRFMVTDNLLIVKSRVAFLKISRTYDRKLIANIKIEHDVSSSETWGFRGMQFPIYKTSVISFTYKGKDVMLGRNSSPFDLEELKKWIS